MYTVYHLTVLIVYNLRNAEKSEFPNELSRNCSLGQCLRLCAEGTFCQVHPESDTVLVPQIQKQPFLLLLKHSVLF